MRGRRAAILRALLTCLLLLALASSGACALTVSGDRQQRISDCLRRCGAQQGADPMAAPPNSHDSYRDTRSPCERECHALR